MTAAPTHLMGLGLRKGTNIGALMLLCGVHFSAGDFPPEIGPFACDASHSLGSICSAIGDTFKGRFQVMHTKAALARL